MTLAAPAAVVLVVVSAARLSGVAAVRVPCAVPCASGLSIATLVIETSFDLSWQMVPMTRASSCLGIKQLFRALLAASI